jgi:hypothetical protein
MPSSILSGPFGAYTPQAAQVIAQAVAAIGVGFTGNVYYCDPVNGLDTNNGQFSASTGVPGQGPVATLAAGYALLRNGFNDVLVLIGNGQATGSARITTFTWAKNAAHLIGICAPSAVSQRARIAFPTTTGLTVTANFFTVSGNGCLFQNLSFFQGAGAGQTGIAAEICLTVSGQRNAFINCDIEGMGDATGATDVGSRNILLTSGENFFQHCNIGLDTVTRTNANASVEVKGNAARNIFENCTFLFYSSDGLQYALLVAAASGLDRWIAFRFCDFINAVGSGSTAIAQLFKLAAAAGGIAYVNADSGWAGVTAIGDATTKALTYAAGGTATNGVKGIVQT